MTLQELPAILVMKLLTETKNLGTIFTSIDTNLFDAKFKLVFDFIYKHYFAWNVMPSIDVVIEFAKNKAGFELLINQDQIASLKLPFQYYYASYLDQKQKIQLSVLVNSIRNIDVEKLDKPMCEELLNSIEDKIDKLKNKYTLKRQPYQSVSQLKNLVKKDYMDMKAKQVDGIQIPFKHISDKIHFWNPGELSFIVARTGVGKTWWTMLCAHKAITCGKKVLYVSCEMKMKIMARRLFAIAKKVKYDLLSSGKLSEKMEQEFFNFIDETSLFDNLTIAEADAFANPKSIGLLARDLGADLVIVDAYYRMPFGTFKSDWERIKALVYEYKAISQIYDVHVQLTNQFNRQARTTQSSNEYSVAGSDAVNQDADYRIDLIQTDDLKRANQIYMKLGKAREGETGSIGKYHWDIKNMKFDFIQEVKLERSSDSDLETMLGED